MSIRSLKASQRINQVQEPIIPIISDLIKKYPNTISLGQGVAYYGPPKSVYKKIKEFGSSIDCHTYSEVEGTEELRKEVTKKLKSENKTTINKKRKVIICFTKKKEKKTNHCQLS